MEINVGHLYVNMRHFVYNPRSVVTTVGSCRQLLVCGNLSDCSKIVIIFVKKTSVISLRAVINVVFVGCKMCRVVFYYCRWFRTQNSSNYIWYSEAFYDFTFTVAIMSQYTVQYASYGKGQVMTVRE